MDATLQSDLQAVADKDQAIFTVSVTAPPVPVEPQTETLVFTPTPPAQ